MLKITDLAVSIEQKPILQGVSLSIAPGTTHALMGPNGSGKSTLGYALMGHPAYALASGSILFDNQDISQFSPDKRAKLGIFLAFQHPLEVPGVSVATFLKEAHQAVTGQQLAVTEFNQLLQEKLALLNLDPSFAHRGLNEGCSGGEKKKLELLQMLVLKPSLVILDEIDSGLDVDALRAVERCIALLRQENPATAVLIISHYPRLFEVMRPDYVHIMRAGKIVTSGGLELVQYIETKGYHGSFVD